jgi:hypothetical protein
MEGLVSGLRIVIYGSCSGGAGRPLPLGPERMDAARPGAGCAPLPHAQLPRSHLSNAPGRPRDAPEPPHCQPPALAMAALAGRVCAHVTIVTQQSPDRRARAAALAAAAALAGGGLAARAAGGAARGGGAIFGRVAGVAADAADAVPGCDVVIVCVPAHAREGALAEIAPHLTNQLVLLLPGGAGCGAAGLRALWRAMGARWGAALASGLTLAVAEVRAAWWLRCERARGGIA